jgi:hypothetical protein
MGETYGAMQAEIITFEKISQFLDENRARVIVPRTGEGRLLARFPRCWGALDLVVQGAFFTW